MFFLAQSTPNTVLSPVSDWVVVVIIAAVIILSGLVVILGRSVLDGSKGKARSISSDDPGSSSNASDTSTTASDASNTLIRSWIAISLVSGLLICCAVAFSLSDETLGGTLFGGLVASTGSAIAFYFSSKTAEQARQDVITASQSTSRVAVPNLVGMSVSDAQAEMSKIPLQLIITNPAAAAGAAVGVVSQTPPAGSNVLSGSQVMITT